MKLISLMAAICLSLTQALDAGVVATINYKADFITTDKIGNLYVVDDDEIIKYDRDGTEIYRYSDKALGNISSIDANNAMKLVVFYQDQSLIAILDNTLSIHGKALSIQDDFDQVTLACRSQREKLWLYDQQNLEIIQTDLNLNISARTGNLTQILGTGLNPTFMVEQQNELFVGDPDNGILVFDNFGAYIKKIPIYADRFQVRNKSIIYQKDGRWFKYNQLLFTETEIQLQNHDFRQLRVEENRLFTIDEEAVNIYSEN